MLNFPLLRQNMKANYKIFLIFLGILTLYITIIISMYNPESMKIMDEFAKTMPEIMSMVGMTGNSTTLMGFLVTYLYGFLFLVIPLIVTIIIANKLVASHIDRGSMAYLLASPNSREKILFTQLKTLNSFIFILIVYITILTITVCSSMFPGELEISKLLILNIGLLIFHLALGSICFLASSIFNEGKYSLIFGAGIPLIFFLIQMIVNYGEKYANLKYFTIFTLFDANSLINNNTDGFVMLGILATIAIILYSLAFIIFKKRDICI